MTDIPRRGLLKIIGTVPVAGLAVARAEAQATHEHKAPAAPAKAAGPSSPRFFTVHEWATVRLLADLVIPKDERSGSATEAGVPEYLDFHMTDPLVGERERESRQTAMRGGLGWLDHECRERFSHAFADSTAAERTAVLDDIAWPEKAKDHPERKPGVRFFTMFRDLVASGFWSSKMGVEDLQYIGNTFVAEWKGPPPEVLKKLGLE